MSETVHVLFIEDSEVDAELVERTLRRGGLDVVVERVDTAEAMNEALDHRAWDVILSDFTMPSFSGAAAFALFRTKGIDVPFIFVSGTVGEDAAVDAMKLGASDYLLKDNLARLAPAIEREVRERQGRKAQKRAANDLRQTLTATEEQLRESQKMEAVGRLASGVAHDFNNMLSVILSYSVLLEQTMPAGDPRLADLREIRDAGMRAANLTRQLLLFSRKQALERQVLDLNALLKEMASLLQWTLGEDVVLACRPCNAPARVRANRGHIEQVLMNLAINARDAMPTGGTLTIATSLVSHVGPSVSGAHVLVAVTDSGVGIDSSTQARIFEPFFTTKERGKGTGLGLSTVFGIMQQSGGAVGVVSEPGKGATFNVYFPQVSAAVETPNEDAPSPMRRGTETILVVEDEDSVRTVTRNILALHGYKVLEARLPEEALSMCARHPEIDLLLTDVVMPGMNGRVLAERFARLRPESKILLVSGYTDDAIVKAEILEAEVQYLGKPFTSGMLATKVREVLDT